jgi:hypothetical protein
MNDAPIPENDAKKLKLLRVLVTILTIVMIFGFLTIITLLVIRFSDVFGPKDAGLGLPEEITLPEGATATAFTKGDGWFAVVADDARILIFDADGTLKQDIAIKN